MSQSENPKITIVIPTRRRARVLSKVLKALAAQTFPVAEFEVIVIMDGDDPSTERMLQACSSPFRLRWHTQAHKGAPAARNLGVAKSGAPLLVFIDDDIVTTPEFLRAHYDCHQQEAKIVVLGALLPQQDSPSKLIDGAIDWTKGYFDRCSQPGYQPSGGDLVDPNFSAKKDDVVKAGGWDEAFQGYGGGDDRDLGLRLERLGLRFRFEVQALGYHNQTKGWADVLRDVRQNGRTFPHYLEKNAGDWERISWAGSSPARRLLFRAVGVCPEFIFTAFCALVRLIDRIVVRGAPGGLWLGLVRLSANVFFVRGIWETPEAARRICLQLSAQSPAGGATGKIAE